MGSERDTQGSPPGTLCVWHTSFSSLPSFHVGWQSGEFSAAPFGAADTAQGRNAITAWTPCPSSLAPPAHKLSFAAAVWACVVKR